MQEKQEQCAGHMTPAGSECHIWATLRQGRDPSKTEACVCFCANCKQDWWTWEASTEMGGLLHQFPPQQRSKGPRGLPENVVGKAKLAGAQSISTTAQGLGGGAHTIPPRWPEPSGFCPSMASLLQNRDLPTSSPFPSSTKHSRWWLDWGHAQLPPQRGSAVPLQGSDAGCQYSRKKGQEEDKAEKSTGACRKGISSQAGPPFTPRS